MKLKGLFITSILSVSLLSSCDIYDLISGKTSHKEKSSSDLSSLKYANFYSYSISGMDYVPESIISGKLPYRKINDVPYITVSDSLSLVYGSAPSSINGDVYTFTLSLKNNSTVTIKVDSSEDTITFSDYETFCSIAVIEDSVVNNICSLVGSESYISYSTNPASSYTKGNATVFDLKSHNLDVIAYDSDVYIPFAIANDVFVSPVGRNFVYNGDDFYEAYDEAFMREGSQNLSTYGTKYFNGSLSVKGKSSDYAEFNYNALCFTIDYFYGFMDKGYAPLDTYLSENNSFLRSSLKSTKETVYQNAVATLLYGILGDGHTGPYGYTSIFGNITFEVSSSVLSDRYIALSTAQKELKQLRSQSLTSSSGVRYYGDTAIITFDEFVSEYTDFNTSTVTRYQSSDSFAFFYSAFKAIKNKGNISNVVIDISLNGGGAVDALVGVLGFLTNDVNVNLYNSLTTSKTSLHYAVDANLDGKVNSSDIQSGYDFYVLTSSYSFSCANLFASICKENNLATIIGETSGGGACVVRSSVTADGLVFQMSGDSRLSTVHNGTYKDIDSGITPDHTLSRSSFYDDSKLVSFVDSL